MHKTEPFSLVIRKSMVDQATALIEPLDTAKRQQILDGARRIFLAQGFDGASMNDIVREAGVSKGTVYAYFPSKEKLFEVLIYQDRRRQAEQATLIENTDRPIETVLYELGLRMVQLVAAEDTLAQFRMVLAVATKFPEVGRSFYEAGPAYAASVIAGYLRTKMDDGTLLPCDAELAALQFVELTLAGVVKPKLFGAACKRQPEEVVTSGVAMFLKALRK
jgi:AcrR family transcriptional regulator